MNDSDNSDFVPAGTELHQTVVKRLNEEPDRLHELNRDCVAMYRTLGFSDQEVEEVMGVELRPEDRQGRDRGFTSEP